MKMKVFAIWDSKAEAYGVPFFMSQSGQAVRAFMDLVNDEQSTVNKHPGDYILFQIGEWVDDVGRFENVIPPVQLGIALDYKKVVGGMMAPEIKDAVREARADMKALGALKEN